MKVKVGCSNKLEEKYGALPSIETPDCVKRKKSNIQPVKDDVLVIVGSYNPKKNSVSLLQDREEPVSSSLLGEQSESITDGDDGLFFGDLEL